MKKTKTKNFLADEKQLNEILKHSIIVLESTVQELEQKITELENKIKALS